MEKTLELYITEIHPGDGLYQFKDQIIGKKFNSFLTSGSNSLLDGWYLVAGVFDEPTGIDILDNANGERPIVFSMARYKL